MEYLCGSRMFQQRTEELTQETAETLGRKKFQMAFSSLEGTTTWTDISHPSLLASEQNKRAPSAFQ